MALATAKIAPNIVNHNAQYLFITDVYYSALHTLGGNFFEQKQQSKNIGEISNTKIAIDRTWAIKCMMAKVIPYCPKN